MEAGLAKHKKQAQDTLKYSLQNGTLFTLRDRRPQEYYPTVIHSEIIGKTYVNYTYYPSGTVNVEVRCSNSPFRLSDEVDRARVHVFFGQIRDRMITFLVDMHERIVPEIMEWYITDCDINKDIK